MSNTPRQFSLLTAVASSIAALGLMFAPASVTDPIRATVRDAIRPGQFAVQSLIDRAVAFNIAFMSTRTAREAHADAAALTAELEAWKLRCRKLQVENALLGEKLNRVVTEGISAYAGTKGRPLIVPELLEAAVYGKERSLPGPSGLLIDKGRAEGAVESALVLKAGGPIVDHGEDAGLLEGQPVYAGRCVVGRVATVGRWSSTVMPLTDANYRGRAQLARHTPQGIVLGAEGILQGQGEPLCRLKFISSTEPVSVGDDVYTGGRTGRLPYPMYYGRVVKAELKPGGAHWGIWVKPAVNADDLQTVQVLREKLNPVRVLGE